MQVQAPALRARLVAADDAQPLALRQSGVIHVGAILNAQHGGLRLHPLHRAQLVRRQDRRHGDLRIIGLLDHPVVRLDGRLVSLSRTAERPPRHRRQRPGELDQPLVGALVSQIRTAEFLRRPTGALQAFGHIQCRQWYRLANAQAGAPIRLKRIDVDGFDRLGMLVCAVLAAAALRLADLLPVRSPVAGADKVRRVDEALHQPGTVAVLRLVVGAQAAQDHALHHGGQVLAIHCSADQEAAHAHHAMHLLATQVRTPAYPLITVGHLQCRGTEAKATQPAVFGADQVTHLRPHQGPSALRVFTQHQLVPHAHQFEPVDDDKRQGENLAGLRRYIDRSRHRLIKTPRALDRTAAMHGRG